jgi:lactoylglutathione lyase
MTIARASISLALLVIRTANISRALEFYRALGLVFVEEQHGAGPMHFSSDLGGVLLEIYPGKPGAAPERMSAGATMLGFRVDSIDRTLSALVALSTHVLTGPVESARGRRAVVEDPDGRAVELREKP